MTAHSLSASGPVFQNAAGTVLAEPAGFLHLTWGGAPRQLTDTQALLDALAAQLRQRGWSRVLTDQTLMPPFSPVEQQWINQTWLPAAAQAGYRTGAVVVAGNVLTRLATAAITTASQPGLPRYRSFDTTEAAAAWLLRQPA